MSLPVQKPPAFLCRRFTDTIEAAMHARYALRLNQDDSILTTTALIEAARGTQVLFATATEQINAHVLQHLSPTLRYVATLSVGHDHIDLAAAHALGIQVLHTPDVLSEACAEIGMMLMLNACRRGYEADRLVRSGQWTGWSPTQLLGQGLTGRRLLIFGMGRIGREIAVRAQAFGLQVHYHNRRRLPADLERGCIHHASLDEALEIADILMIAAPGSAALRGVIDARRIARMPAQAVLVNISRGDLVDDTALISALISGHLFAAGLDVFANEPHIDPRYRTLDNVFLAPHIGSATRETREAMGWLLLRGLDQLFQGGTPDNLLPAAPSTP